MNDITDEQMVDRRLLLDKVPFPLLFTNNAGIIYYLNSAAKSLGLVAGKPIWESLSLALGNSLQNFNDSITAAPVQIEHNGNSFSYSITVSSYLENENERYLYTLVHPLAAPKVATLAPMENFAQTAFHNRMVEEIEDYAILMLDPEGNIINWNKGAQSIKGYTADEIIGRNFETFYTESDRETALPQKLLSQAASEGKATAEGWRKRKDGSVFWGYVVITAVHDTAGEIIGFTKVTRDLTERKLAEEQREQQARNIEAQNRQLEQFAYITSHDLQEPVRKIQVFAELIQNNIDDKDFLIKYVTKISTSSARISALIKDILQYTRVLQTPGKEQKTDLNTVLSGVSEDLELLISEKKAQIKVLNPLPVLPAIPVQMQQLFTNLINNAIKFSDKNPVIEISSYRATANNIENVAVVHYQCLEFKDNGIGFEQKYVEEIFKPFKRLSSGRSGTGIGLALCKKIIENHGGFIQVSSKLQEGTVFKVYLPE